MSSQKEKDLRADMDYVVKHITELLTKFNDKEIPLNLVLHTTISLLYDVAIDTAPDRRTLFGLLSSAMAAAYESNMKDYEDSDKKLDETEATKEDLVH